MGIAYYILSPFTWLLQVFYDLFHSYGMALILFAIVVKVILFPLTLKGKRSMIQMNMLSGKMQKLQKMYANNKEKYNLEVQKLYEKEKVNPMSGCLWSLVPLFILIPLYAIIRQPIKYMMGVGGAEMENMLNAIANAVNWNSVAVSKGWIKEAAGTFANIGYNQLHLASLITPENLGAVKEAVAAVGTPAKELFSINFNFLGFVDLSQTPVLKFWTISGGFGLFILPVISAVASLLFSVVSMKTNAINQQSQAGSGTNKMMMLMNPLISLWIGFSMPAALCVYWIIQSVISLLQEILASKLLKKDYEKAAEEAKRREEEEKEEERRQREEERIERARRIEEAKKNKNKKKKDDEEKTPGIDKTASREGLRAYARGRAYDPYRFSTDGPTPYEGVYLFRKEKDAAAPQPEPEVPAEESSEESGGEE